MKTRKSGSLRTIQDHVFIHRLLLAMGLVGLTLALWQLREIVLLLFGAIVIATILHSLTDPIIRYTPLPRKWAFLVSILSVVLMTALICWFAGSEISLEFASLSQQLPEAWRSFQEAVKSYALGGYLFEKIAGLQSDSGGLIAKVSTIAISIVNSITDIILIFVGGLYFAVDPALYREGVLKLTPPSVRARTAEVLDYTGAALRKWLLAKLAEMALVGILTAIGLLMIGFPSALALGLVAGIAEFVPYVGLIVAVIPAILIALTLGPEMLVWTILVYTLVQQLEGNAIMPLIEQKMVYIPPVLTIFSIVVFGILFGPLGLIFAAPLIVVLMVLVKKIYIEGALGESA